MSLGRSLVLPIALVVLVSACGGTSSETAMSGMGEMTEEEHADGQAHKTEDEHGDEAHAAEDDHSFAFGAPAQASQADRTVVIEASDEMAFDPDSVDVPAGEVITFEVENIGKIPHDFTLGDEHAQEEHEQEMAESMESGGMEMAHDDPNVMTVEPGETGSLTWSFTESGTVLYGCHQPGHYEAGMVGAVVIP
ncbi:MAG: cupredoxin domain-containing protein [Egibacteraceae bacterium]